MRKLTWVLTVVIAFNITSIFANEKGNGGGGVKVNGVYKTFYSAGVVVNPTAEDDIPGSALYLQTIGSLIENGDVATRLISSAIPMEGRTFYRILEDQMDKTVMVRLLEEYARVTKQTNGNLTIFAITDIGSRVTYLLPSFYQLTEAEQAAIIFHESYWILNPQASYAEVVGAEMAFQEYIEKTQAGGFSLKLPRILDKLTSEKYLAIKTALLADATTQSAPELIDQKQNISIGGLFLEEKHCDLANDFTPSSADEPLVLNATVNCKLQSKDIEDVLMLSKKYPRSLFLKELVNFLMQNNNLQFVSTYSRVVLRTEMETGKARARIQLFSKQKIELKLNEN